MIGGGDLIDDKLGGIKTYEAKGNQEVKPVCFSMSQLAGLGRRAIAEAVLFSKAVILSCREPGLVLSKCQQNG